MWRHVNRLQLNINLLVKSTLLFWQCEVEGDRKQNWHVTWVNTRGGSGLPDDEPRTTERNLRPFKYSLILSCLCILSTFRSLYWAWMVLQKPISSTNSLDKTPCWRERNKSSGSQHCSSTSQQLQRPGTETSTQLSILKLIKCSLACFIHHVINTPEHEDVTCPADTKTTL